MWFQSIQRYIRKYISERNFIKHIWSGLFPHNFQEDAHFWWKFIQNIFQTAYISITIIQFVGNSSRGLSSFSFKAKTSHYCLVGGIYIWERFTPNYVSPTQNILCPTFFFLLPNHRKNFCKNLFQTVHIFSGEVNDLRVIWLLFL